ncbi:MAG: 23S rRNA (adenine(2503)-C(2))-methyltransferase RlmN [Candidatus Paceibacterota bacterium]|jgi:23S rRNA (adenine2503-C2)-methyltransferase|nr:23S rRNA (adenine(2503)-C(2))-methyltransferase RlmN [bacterium]
MNLENLDNLLKEEKPFRRQQVMRAIFRELITNWDEATNLSLQLREKIKDTCSLDINSRIFESKDKNTIKALITLQDGKQIETVLMLHTGNRSTVCVSSQVGCPIGCLFCATGKMGFFRDLTVYEILEQVLFFARYLKSKGDKQITNIVFMGMGEPFLNYDNVLSAVRIINNGHCFNIGSRKISISTSGIIEGIEKMANEDMQVNLSISLHAPNNALREAIMPINSKYSIEKLIGAVDAYIDKTSRKVMYEYVMLKGVNDTLECAEELVRLFRKKSLCMINLIIYNPTGDFEPSDDETVKGFKNFLETHGLFVTQRYEFGQAINAACGQLASSRIKK